VSPRFTQAPVGGHCTGAPSLRSGVIEGIAERAVLREEYVKGERERLLTRTFMTGRQW
jgi:hypothetical protein